MKKKENIIKLNTTALRALHEKDLQKELDYNKNRTLNEMIAMFKIEKDAKNKAYYFILENSLYEKFREYSYNY